jgi:hypothetical protein
MPARKSDRYNFETGGLPPKISSSDETAAILAEGFESKKVPSG